MTKEEYQEYLQSEHWLSVREERKKIDNYRCILCGSSENINVHHLSYENIGEENIYLDLLTLCKRCHFLLHDAIGEAKPKVEQCHEEFKTKLRIYVENNADMKEIYSQYEEKRGEIFAEALTPFCDIIPASNTNKLLSIFNKACYKPFAKIVMDARLHDAIRLNAHIGAYSVGCSKFSAIRKQRRRF